LKIQILLEFLLIFYFPLSLIVFGIMKKEKLINTSVRLPKQLFDIIQDVQRARGDPTRTDTIRFLLMHALAELSFLPEESKKAHGVGRGGGRD
jgi:hypothetical protein